MQSNNFTSRTPTEATPESPSETALAAAPQSVVPQLDLVAQLLVTGAMRAARARLDKARARHLRVRKVDAEMEGRASAPAVQSAHCLPTSIQERPLGTETTLEQAPSQEGIVR